jgi:POT family proton-dependent oligopeptide transporter
VPWIRTNFGFNVAFYSTAALMAAAILIFLSGKRFYPPEEVRFGGSNSNSLRTPDEKRADRAVLVRLLGVFTVIIFFWSVYDQTMSTWIFFARDHIDLKGLDPDQFQALNPWLIVALTPVFNWLWNRLNITKATTKMMVGYLLTAVCMGTIALASLIASDGRVNMVWIIGAYVVVTLAELCLSVVGLEFAFSEAPEHMKSQLTSLFLFTVFVGDILAGLLASIYPRMTPACYFGMLTAMMTVVSVIFYFVARNYDQRKKAEATPATS